MILNSNVKAGDRIKVTHIYTGNPEGSDELGVKYDKKLEGQCATVTEISYGPEKMMYQIWCKFDNGRHVALLADLDKYIVIKDFEF
jgi:hypothetical protein